MKRTLAALAVLVCHTSRAQGPALPEEVITIHRDAATGAISVSWQAVAGRTYFLQHNPTLVSPTNPSAPTPWIYWPDGADLRRFETAQTSLLILDGITGDRSFFRLKYTDAFPTTDPQTGDADGDRVSNADEVNLGLDPFSNVDSDGDGLPDDWEKFWFSGNLNRIGGGNEGDDLFTNFEEFMFGLNPGIDDSATDLEELSYDALGRLQSARGSTYSHDTEGNLLGAAN